MIIVIFCSCGVACKSDKVKILSFAHNLPKSHPVHKGVLVLKKELEKRSKGKLILNIYSDGQLGSEREVLELLQIGSISMTKVSTAAMSNFVPEYKVLGVPYIFRDKKHLFKVLEGKIGDELLMKGTEYWLRGLCFYDAGSRSFYTKTKFIKTPEDLKGMKIRVMNDKMSVEMVNTLGGSPTPMSFGELYTALQQGVVDGAENNAPSFVSSRHFEICKYYSLDAHSYVPDVLLISTKALKKLTPQEQEWVQKSAKASAKKQKILWKQAEDESMKILKESGVQFFYPKINIFADKTEQLRKSFSTNSKMKRLMEEIQKEK